MRKEIGKVNGKEYLPQREDQKCHKSEILNAVISYTKQLLK